MVGRQVNQEMVLQERKTHRGEEEIVRKKRERERGRGGENRERKAKDKKEGRVL